MKITKSILIIGLFMIAINNKAQEVDYLKIRNQYITASCGNHDSSYIFTALTGLNKLDTNNLKNLESFFLDKGFLYYLAYAKFKDSNNLNLAVADYKSALGQNSKSSGAWYNLMVIYSLKNDCNSLIAMNNYIGCTPKKMRVKDQIKIIKNRCDN